LTFEEVFLALIHRRVTTSTITGDHRVYTAVTFAKGPLVPKAFPGAGIIGAGLFVNEFMIPSKIDPDSHMKRLSADFSDDATENVVQKVLSQTLLLECTRTYRLG